MGRTIVLCFSLVVIAIFVILPFCFSIRQTNNPGPEPKAAAVDASAAAVTAASNSAECSNSSRMLSRDVRTLFGGEPHSNAQSAVDIDNAERDKKPAQEQEQQQDSPESVASTPEIVLERKQLSRSA